MARRKPGTAWVIAVVAGAALLAAPSAAGAGQLTTRQASAELPADFETHATATAACPRGARAVSGGWLMDPLSAGVQVIESRRIGVRRWRVSVVNAGAAAEARLTAFAYCDRSAPRATVVKVTVPDTLSSIESATARCPRGRVATAGGFLGETGVLGQALLPLESGRAGRRSWEVIAHQAGFAPADLTAFAYCTPGLGSARERVGTAPLTAGGGTVLSGRCPKRSGSRSGGFEVAYQTSASKYGISQSRRAGRRWRTTAVILAPSAPDTEVSSRAYCP